MSAGWQFPSITQTCRSTHSWLCPDHLHGIIVIDTNLNLPLLRPLTDLPLQAPRRGTLGAALAKFKAASARHVNLLRDTQGPSLWQRGYYEHIIRDEHDLDRIRRYIEQNPVRWQK